MSSRYNEGVAAKIKYAKGSIGYVEYGIAKRSGLSMASLENKNGVYVRPSDTSGTVTLANTSDQMPANLRLFISRSRRNPLLSDRHLHLDSGLPILC